ncbi:MAG: hypothetical protein EBW30_05935 [Synechococcaceae bacterium WB7_3xG_012]|nr:hypothetical protein [Synechococcaceae bacterium WB7_3xG_012]
MAKAGAPQKQAPNGLPRIWMGPLVAGVSFALAYGITQRLAAINLGDVIRLSPRFEQKQTPGVTLKDMRLRYGEQPSDLRSDLDPQQLELWRKAQEQADADQKAKAEAEAKAEREAATEAAPKPVAPTEEPAAPEPKPVVEAPKPKPTPKPKPQVQAPAPRPQPAAPAPQQSVPLLDLPPLQ